MTDHIEPATDEEVGYFRLHAEDPATNRPTGTCYVHRESVARILARLDAERRRADEAEALLCDAMMFASGALGFHENFGIDYYEWVNERFRRETGSMAPGKDPGPYATETGEDRRAKWHAWIDTQRARLHAEFTRQMEADAANPQIGGGV